jgi:hypothetical protein
LGRVAKFEQGLPWWVLFPDSEHVAASEFLRHLAASDCSPATLRSLVEARDRAWLGEVAPLEESLRQRRHRYYQPEIGAEHG